MSKTDRGERIGRRVADRRRDRGWDQSELARRAGVRPSYVNRLEAGQYGRPSAERLSLLARALGCELADLAEPASASSSSGIRGYLVSMGMDPEEESELAAEIIADMVTIPAGRERLDTLKALRTILRPRPAQRP